MRFYRLTNCISAQIEAVALFNLRLGAQCFGLAYPRSWQALRHAAWGWREHFPRLSLAFGIPAHQNDKRIRFEVRINRFELSYAAPGQHTDFNLHSACDIGLTMRYGSRWVTIGPRGLLRSWEGREVA